MGLARDLTELEARLREQTDVDLFSPIDQGGLPSTPEFASVMARFVSREPSAAIRLCLQALRVQYEEIRPRLIDAELVATLPPAVPGIARPTQRVVQEMISSAENEVIVLGYEFTARDVVSQLAEAAARGVGVTMICDRGRGSAQSVLDAWPSGSSQPRIFHDRPRADSTAYASMHAKCLLVDGRDLLVTSANFTFHGLHGNIEIGVRLSGPPAAEARKIFSHLVDSGVLNELRAGD